VVDSGDDSQVTNVRRIPVEADVLLAYSVVPGDVTCSLHNILNHLSCISPQYETQITNFVCSIFPATGTYRRSAEYVILISTI